MNFQTWKEQKKVKDGDLIFTRSLKTEADKDLFLRIADQMAALSPSFREGVAFLETATELILMGYLEQLLENGQDFSSWSRHMKALRYPGTSEREARVQSNLSELPWPAGSKLKFERRGDKFGVEMKVFISNPADVTKIIASLERVKQEMKT